MVFALVGLALAVGAHRVGGGVVPGLPVLGGAAAGLGSLGWLLAARERSGRLIAGVVVATQAVLHAAFSLAMLLPALLGRQAGSTLINWAAVLFCHHGKSAITSVDIKQATAGLDLSRLHPTSDRAPSLTSALMSGNALAMLVGHLSAALIVAWWLRRGERAVWAAADRVITVVRGLAGGVPQRALNRYRQMTSTAWRPNAALLVSMRASRAPPGGPCPA